MIHGWYSFINYRQPFNSTCKSIEKIFRRNKEEIKRLRVLTADDNTSTMPKIKVNDIKVERMNEIEYMNSVSNLFTQFSNSFFCFNCHIRDEHLQICPGYINCPYSEYHNDRTCSEKTCYNNLFNPPEHKIGRASRRERVSAPV